MYAQWKACEFQGMKSSFLLFILLHLPFNRTADVFPHFSRIMTSKKRYIPHVRNVRRILKRIYLGVELMFYLDRNRINSSMSTLCNPASAKFCFKKKNIMQHQNPIKLTKAITLLLYRRSGDGCFSIHLPFHC
jgi:hypothetical protein